MSSLSQVSSSKCFGGYQKVYSHESTTVGCKMTFAVYLPPQAETGKVPLLFWLSGLSCTEQNFITKSGFQRYAAEHGVAIVCPDTSPRNCKIEGDNDCWWFGESAGFYVDAVTPLWKDHYRMYSYVTEELPNLVAQHFPVDPDRTGIFGHSMGGHGALICFFKNPGKYKSVSAFAPICHPMTSPWGQHAFRGYLGEEGDLWKQYDASELVSQYNGPPIDILIDQGSADQFFVAGQLQPQQFVQRCAENKVPVIYREHEGYDHGYYFVSTLIAEHIRHHADRLRAQ